MIELVGVSSHVEFWRGKELFFGTRNKLKILKENVLIKEKTRRKSLRTIKKGFLNKEKEIDIEESYVAGGF